MQSNQARMPEYMMVAIAILTIDAHALPMASCRLMDTVI